MLPPGKVSKVTFERGLDPRIGDTVYFRRDKRGDLIATTKSPNDSHVKRVLFWVGVMRREPCIRVGIVTYADSYFEDRTCLVMYT